MSELYLNENMAKNYVALQNFLNGIEVGRKPQKGASYSKSPSRKATKIRKIQEQGECCLDCGMKFTFDGERYVDATVDHVIPYRYGSNLDHNGEFVCQPCNKARENNRLEVITRYFGQVVKD